MKKILISFCIFLSVLTIGAQGNKTTKQPAQQDLDRALKDAQDLINKQDLPPEVKEYFKNSNVNPADITKSIQIDKATMDAYKNQPKGIINTDTIMDEEVEAEMRLASIGTTSTQKIGPEGGVVTSKNGKVKLTIPKGALTKLTEIRIIESKNEAPNGCGNSFSLLPDGLVFNIPAKITLKYTHNEINGTSPEALRILTKTNDGNYEVYMNTELDIFNKTITSDIPHFSIWGFASMYQLKLIPEIGTIVKGQKVKLYISGWIVHPKDKEDTVKWNGKKMIESQIKIIADATKKVSGQMNTDILKNKGAYQGGPGFYRIKNWKLDGDNPDKSQLGVLIPVPGDLTEANYTAPNKISQNWMTRIINISVELEENTDYEFAPLFKGELKLLKRMVIIEKGELNYYVGNELVPVKSIQLTNSILVAKAATNNNNFDNSKQRIVSCYFSHGDLIIASGNSTINGGQPGLSLCIEKPKLGENLLTCHQNLNSQGYKRDIRLYGYGTDDFIAENYEIKRGRNTNGGCDDLNTTCHDFVVNITELNNEVGGMVSGSFSGILYQDGERFKDACKNSKETQIHGYFTLTISRIDK